MLNKQTKHTISPVTVMVKLFIPGLLNILQTLPLMLRKPLADRLRPTKRILFSEECSPSELRMLETARKWTPCMDCQGKI